MSSRQADGEGSPKLSARDLGIKRGNRWLVRKMNWEIPHGKFLAVVGPSGCGKTSLLSVLCGLLPPCEGSVNYFCGKEVACQPREFQSRLGIVFQNLRLVANQDLLSNVLCGRLGQYPWWRTLFSFPRKDRCEALALLAELGLGQDAARWVAETSGGEQQRTAVARAIFQNPEVILADEPVSNLDLRLAEKVLTRFRSCAQEKGVSVVCTLHNAALVRQFSDFILQINPENPEGWEIRENAPY